MAPCSVRKARVAAPSLGIDVGASPNLVHVLNKSVDPCGHPHVAEIPGEHLVSPPPSAPHPPCQGPPPLPHISRGGTTTWKYRRQNTYGNDARTKFVTSLTVDYDGRSPALRLLVCLPGRRFNCSHPPHLGADSFIGCPIR